LHKTIFNLANFFLLPIKYFSKSPNFPSRPQKILIANAGHLGDLIICTAAIRSVREKWPEAEIGLLCTSSIEKISKNFSGVKKFYYLDHWHIDRSEISLPKKLLKYALRSHILLKEIRAENYSIAIDLRIWFPNFIPLLWRAGIPIRIGTDRIGFSALLSKPTPFIYKRKHESEFQLDILNSISSIYGEFFLMNSVLNCLGVGRIESLKMLLQEYALKCDARYRVIHVGSSTPVRDWPVEKWRNLSTQLISRGAVLIFTGAGGRENSMISEIIEGIDFCINACDLFSLDDLINIIANADLVYSVETSIGHIAGALQIPVVSLYGGTADPCHWRPLGKVQLVTLDLKCSPCFDQLGCNGMSCIREIEVKDVLSAGDNLKSGLKR
jgi:ADP-heptose:LPS heptosyltransferase